jgi:PAS domain S-box-containing protein
MPLDTITMLMALAVLCCTFSFVMLLIWRFFSSGLPMLLWALSMGFCGMGSLLVALRDRIPPFFSYIAGNLLVVSGFCLVWWGVSIHRGSKPCRRAVSVSVLLFIALFSWFVFVEPDMAWRGVILRSFSLFYLAGAMATLLKGGVKRLTPMERVALAALSVNLLFNLLAAGMQLAFLSYREPLRYNAFIAFTALLSLIGITLWGLAVILVKQEKLMDEIRRAENSSRSAKNLLETIIDNIPSLIYLKDLQGRVLVCNRRLANLLGLAPEEVLGRTSHDLFPLALADRQRDYDLAVARSGEMLVTDELLELADGRHLFETTRLAVRNRSGEITSLCGISTDVTERRGAETALRESQKLFDTIANSSPALVWMSGEDGGCTWFNEVWLSFTGRSLEQELGNGWAEGVHPDDLDHCLRIYGESFAARRSFSMEYRLRRHDGEFRWLLDQGHPRYNTSGAFCGYIGSCLDITELTRTQEMLKQKNDEIELFIYTVSHDLRSPLVTIKSFLGYLEQDMEAGDGGRIGQDLQFIHGAADKMERLLTELLDMSRIGRKDNPPEKVTFRELATEALSSVAGYIVDLKVGVRVTDMDQPLRGDRPRLAQIWQNLLDNAVKYMGDQPDPCVELGMVRHEGEVVFFVRDNGIGIAPEHRERVFGMFDKLDQESAGVGLGLAMVKRIVENYNGRIWVESSGRGCGACFNFTLPGAILPEGEE